jgi:hypothetical protein
MHHIEHDKTKIKNLPYGTLGPEGKWRYDTDLHYGIAAVYDIVEIL